MKKKTILIIGTVPPQIGGVTIHVDRLLVLLNKKKVNFVFFDYKRQNLFSLFKYMFNSNYYHVHINNLIFLWALSILSFLFRKKMIFTKHGYLDLRWDINSFFQYITVKLSFIPIMINKKSFEKAKSINNNSILLSSFIPPIEEEKLKPHLIKEISLLKNRCKMVFSTNAFDFVFDKHSNEIYGIISLIKIFKNILHLGLVISDPSGNYSRYLRKNKMSVSKNILLIGEPHSFFEVLKLTDCLIRNTTTDGDSISIKEAIYLNKKVIATNCVDRPEGVKLIDVKDSDQIKKEILNCYSNRGNNNRYSKIKNGGEQLIELYKKL